MITSIRVQSSFRDCRMKRLGGPIESKKQSDIRRVENEVIFKEHNLRIQRQADRILPPDTRQTFPIGFICECSDEMCQERIEMPYDDFQSVSKNLRHFIIKPGHEQTDIERVITVDNTYSVVEKFELPVATTRVLNKT